MTQLNIKPVLESSNPWWDPTSSFIHSSFNRQITQEIESHLNNPAALVLIGPRQSGKTTIFYQVIKYLLTQTKDPKYIVYVPMDRMKNATLHDIIRAHRELTAVYGKTYYFFDEVHYDPEWAVHLKTLIDAQTQNKYLATGSSSTLLLKDSAESGIGRFDFKTVSPFSFREFILVNGFPSHEMEELTLQSDLLNIMKKLQDIGEVKLLTFKRHLEPLLQKYLLFGGFPAQFGYKYNILQWQNYLRLNYVSLTLYKDILSRYEVRDPSILEDLLLLIAEKTTLPLSYDSIGKMFNISIETARQYLHYLEAAGLIIICDYYTMNISKRTRRNKKFYIIDPGLTTALKYTNFLSDNDMSKNIETTVAAHLANYLKVSTGLLNPKISYWKEKYEVDFVIKSGIQPVPIEVKYTNNITMNNLKGLISFLNNEGLSTGFVITKDIVDVWDMDTKQIILLPAWLVLCCLEGRN
ncbi:MAG: ATP-binding protein [Methanosarcinales archaeon]|nr:ATP-binding protein [Methanosarcinales archaeon]